jgi:alcohol dehydrogenase (cytochrome c)
MSSSLRALSLLAIAAPIAAFAQNGSRASAHAFSAERLTAPPTTNWPTNGGNLYNQRYSSLSAINRDNVAQLKGVWRARLRGSGVAPKYSGEGQPVAYDGTVYMSTGANDVFALSLDTGEILWQYVANLSTDLPAVCCGWNNRGVAVSEDKVFIGRLDARLVALDRKTGEEVWSVQAERHEENFSITPAPVYYDGMVITGFAGADRGTRGRVKAYDADDGKLLWTFYTIPAPGEPGHETWPQHNDSWKYGGASVWQTPAIDPELGLVYFSTGNAGPDYNGAVRPGDNLYSVSIVAVELKTGKYRWHFQQVHHDIWDYDSPNPVILMDLQMDGGVRKAIVEVGKTGWAYILDRVTGEPIIGIDERPVPQEPLQATAATQPYPRGDAIVPQEVQMAPEGFKLVNQGRIFTPHAGENPTIVKPAHWGGANWPPSAYDPERQYLFVCATSAVVGFTAEINPEFVAPTHGGRFGMGRTRGTSQPRMGVLAALDTTTNKLVWRYRWPEQCYSGTLATAGGLLFVGRNDGRLTAVDSDTGMQLWEFQTGAGMHAPVSTVEHRGKQYILAYSAGNALIGSPRGDSVWLFGLDGTLPPVEQGVRVSRLAEAPPEVSGTATATAATGQVDVVNGEALYEETCVICHGVDGKGGHGGGPPLNELADVAAALNVITAGRNNMPPFGQTLTAEQIRDISAYVVEELPRRRE